MPRRTRADAVADLMAAWRAARLQTDLLDDLAFQRLGVISKDPGFRRDDVRKATHRGVSNASGRMHSSGVTPPCRNDPR